MPILVTSTMARHQTRPPEAFNDFFYEWSMPPAPGAYYRLYCARFSGLALGLPTIRCSSTGAARRLLGSAAQSSSRLPTPGAASFDYHFRGRVNDFPVQRRWRAFASGCAMTTRRDWRLPPVLQCPALRHHDEINGARPLDSSCLMAPAVASRSASGGDLTGFIHCITPTPN